MRGIACPLCGSTLSDVYDTRQGEECVTRKRRCINEHTFETKERAGDLILPPRPATEAKSVSIRAALRKGESPEDIAKRLDCSLSYVHNIGRQIIRSLKGTSS